MLKKLMMPLIVVGAIIVVVLIIFTAMGWDNIAADLNYQYLDSYDEATNSASVSWYIGRSSNITIPSKIYDVNITSIGGKFAKRHPEVLESVTMNDNIVSIEEKAFSYGCENLKTIKLSNKLTKIGSDAFKGCTALESISIPEGVTQLNATTFSGCTALKTVTLPDSITSIDETAFEKCENVSITYKGNTYSYADISKLVAAAAA